MIFEIGKTYEFSTGKRMRIVAEADTATYGVCLIGEELKTGELVPVGKTEEYTVNWKKVDMEAHT